MPQMQEKVSGAGSRSRVRARRRRPHRARLRHMVMVQRVVSSSGPVRRMSCRVKVGEKTRRSMAMLNR